MPPFRLWRFIYRLSLGASIYWGHSVSQTPALVSDNMIEHLKKNLYVHFQGMTDDSDFDTGMVT